MDEPVLSKPHIGTLTEKSLHAALKTWYSQSGDLLEVRVEGYVVDIVRGNALIEIQTRGFSSLKQKLSRLLENHPVQLVYPIAREKTIVRLDKQGHLLSQRKSPKRGTIDGIFNELIYIPHLITHPNLTFTVVFTRQEEIWLDDGKGSWRRKRWSIGDHQLLEVIGDVSFHGSADLMALLPADLPQPFSNADLHREMDCPLRLAQKMTNTLYKIGGLTRVKRKPRGWLYQKIKGYWELS
jgi:hypothetical protein